MPKKKIDLEYWEELRANIEKDTSNTKSEISKDRLNAYLYEIFRNYEKIPYTEVSNLFKKISEYDKYKDIESLDELRFPEILIEADPNSVEIQEENKDFLSVDTSNYMRIVEDNKFIVFMWAMDALDLVGILETYSLLAEDDISKSVLNPAEAKDKEMRELYLFVAIKISKDNANAGNYQKAIEPLKYLLDGIHHYHCFSVFYTLLIYSMLIIFLFLVLTSILNIFLEDIYSYVPIGLVNTLFLTLVVFSALIILLNDRVQLSRFIEHGAFIFGKINKIQYSILNFFLTFSLLIFALLISIFIYPLFSSILTISFSINFILGYIVLFVGGVVSLIFLSFILIEMHFNSEKLKEKPLSYQLGLGLYHYFKGRLDIQKYLELKSKSNKLKFLELAIKDFSTATEVYEKSFSNFDKSNELGLCPYCLNFYLCINDYENLVRTPEKNKIKDFEDKIKKINVIMDETGQGSETISKLLKKLLKATKSLENLRARSKKFPNLDSIDRARINKEIKENYREIDNIIKEIDEVISNIEGKNLPIIIKIMEEKSKELKDLNIGMKDHKAKGFEVFFSKRVNDIIGIIFFLCGVALLIVGSFYTLIYSYIGILLTIIGSILMSLPKIKKWIY
ncbi:hypothetical protein [Methanobacterium petrolearium]|uniref:hypothetical protein n=1 Tax=Methanobacterium petrolearium TaxID=710190 RepID=UPI001AE8E44A|nr:hypothetical protein [Methanobacterium petrolearium]MBP1945202.1 hypothetical protein [Methanobacterium petrolearium]